MNSTRGITLVEVMVALVIFSIIIVPSISFLQSENKKVQNYGEKSIILLKGEIDSYFSDYEHYKGKMADSVVLDNQIFKLHKRKISNSKMYSHTLTCTSDKNKAEIRCYFE